jgi:hypothetical protein
VWLNRRWQGAGPWDKHGRFAPLDWATLHSGCDLKEAKDGTQSPEKWIANQWVWKDAVERLCGIEAANVNEELETAKREAAAMQERILEMQKLLKEKLDHVKKLTAEEEEFVLSQLEGMEKQQTRHEANAQTNGEL